MSKSQKLLNRMSKKATHTTGSESHEKDPDLKRQYKIIRDDLLKLREDLETGYDMAKSYVGKKGLIATVLKAR